MTRATTPHKVAWAGALAAGIRHCHYCDHRFSANNPPTRDHITPKSHGGTLNEIVYACQDCNVARGNAPYDLYLEAVIAERKFAQLEGRSYRRPKLRTFPDGRVITTLPPWAMRAIRSAGSVTP